MDMMDMKDKMRIVQELVPGRQITLAHIIANPDPILYQKLGMKDRLAYAVMSEEQILDSILAMSDTLVDAYANAGIAVESVEKKNISFLGEDRVAMYTVASVQGIPYYILQLYYYNLGAYSVTLTVGSFVEDNSQSVLELFYSLEK